MNNMNNITKMYHSLVHWLREPWKDEEWIYLDEIPTFLGDTVEKRIKNYLLFKKQGFKLVQR